MYGLGEPTRTPDREYVDSQKCDIWRFQCLSFLKIIISKESPHQDQITKFDNLGCVPIDVYQGVSILKGIQASLENGLLTVSAASQNIPRIDELCNLLRGVPAGLRRWTWEQKSRTKGGDARKWHIDNEYHVQNLLCFLLTPTFPDVTDEEPTPPVGQAHPRLDLGVPSLKTIVEVKFMRATDTPQSMIEQIAADASLYLVEDSRYSNIIVFIWDDSRRIEQHHMLINGLKQISGVIDAVVVSRPGIMHEA